MSKGLTFSDALTDGPTMKVDAILSRLDGEDAGGLRRALEDKTTSSQRIAAALNAIGHDIHVSSVKRWRDAHAVR